MPPISDRTSAVRGIRARRKGRAGHVADRAEAQSTPSPGSETSLTTDTAQSTSIAAPREPRRDHDPRRDRERRAAAPEDAALYTCACGFAFAAPVTSTVACPHCGDAQAW